MSTDNEYDLDTTIAEFMHDVLMFTIQKRRLFRLWFNEMHESEYSLELIMHRLGMMHTIADSNLAREERAAREALREAVLGGSRMLGVETVTDDTGQYL